MSQVHTPAGGIRGLTAAVLSWLLCSSALFPVQTASAAEKRAGKQVSSTGLGAPVLGFINKGDWKSAEALLQEECSAESGPSVADFWLAFAYLFYNQCENLEKLSSRIAGAKESVPAIAGSIQALNLACRGKLPEAQKALDAVAVPGINSQKVAYEYALAVVAGKKRDSSKAASRLTEVTGLAPDFVWAYRTLGYLQLQGLKDPNAAVASLSQAVELNPSYDEARDLLVDAYLARNDFDSAIDTANEAVKLNPRYASGHYRLAQILIKQWRLKEALTQLKTGIKLDPGDARLYRACAQIHRYHRDFSDALAEQQKAVDLAKDKVLELNELATLNIDAGYPDKAVDNLRQALNIDPANQYIQDKLLRLLSHQKRYDDLVAEYRKVLSTNPKDFVANLALADTLRTMGRTDEATQEYKNAAVLDPASPKPNHELALIYLSRKDYDHAIKEFTRALNNNPSSVEDLGKLGYAYVQNGDYKLAEAAFVTALAVQQLTQPAMGPVAPADRLDLMRQLADLFLREGRYAEAASQLANIAASEKDSPSLLSDQFALAVCKAYRSRTRKAAEELLDSFAALPPETQDRRRGLLLDALLRSGNMQLAEPIISKIPQEELGKNDELMLLAAHYKRESGDIAGAGDLVAKAVAADGNNSDAYLEESHVLLAKGDAAGAEKAAAKALELNPKSFKACRQLGRVYQAQKKYSNALEACNQSISINPYWTKAYVLMGDVLAAQGKYRDALTQYKKAIELYPTWMPPHAGLVQCYKKLAMADEAAQEERAISELKGAQ